MKVLYLASWYPNRMQALKGIFVRRHAQAAARFCGVTVLAAFEDRSMKRRFEISDTVTDGIREIIVYYRLPFYIPKITGLLKSSYLPYLSAMGRGFARLVRAGERFDLAQANVAQWSGLYALLLCALRGLRYVVLEHSTGYMPADGSAIARPRQAALSRLIFGKAEAVIAVSSTLADALSSFMSGAETLVVPNVIDFPRMDRPPPSGKPCFINVSLMSDRQKNISGILKAFAGFASRFAKARLILVGDGSDRRRLEDLAGSLGISHQVEFKGMLQGDALHEVMAEADAAIINSRFETFCVVAAEALSAGLPVICTRCGGPESFVDASNGILIDIESDEQLESAMEEMATDSGRFDRARISSQARARFSPEAVSASLFEAYARIIEGWAGRMEAGNKA
jgi:glycosyltransferase involved in cell wall biosynthesis